MAGSGDMGRSRKGPEKNLACLRQQRRGSPRIEPLGGPLRAPALGHWSSERQGWCGEVVRRLLLRVAIVEPPNHVQQRISSPPLLHPL